MAIIRLLYRLTDRSFSTGEVRSPSPLTVGLRAAEGDMKRIGDKERPSSEDWTGESRSSA
jgi:hypothetical protein